MTRAIRIRRPQIEQEEIVRTGLVHFSCELARRHEEMGIRVVVLRFRHFS
jgi:hypothetical protein